jgi:hypothetical protein
MVENYNKLKPGMYLQVGSNIKSVGREYLGSFSALMADATARSGIEALAASVGWVFVALEKRKAKILEIPNHWERGNDRIDTIDIAMKQSRLVQQTDESLQLYKCAYWLKQRGEFSQAAKWIRWLDPTMVEPDYDTADVIDGIQRYFYTDNKTHHRTPIPATDIIDFSLPGLRELLPGTPAGAATKLAALVLQGIDQSSATFFGNNALPIMLITVADGTGTPEINRLKAFFSRIANQRRGTDHIRTTAVRGDVKVEQLSLAPKDLAQKDLEESKIDVILAAHDVPKSVALSNAANYATDIAASRRFTQAMGARYKYIAETINGDEDFRQAGLMLVVTPELHPDMKEDEAQRSQSFVQFMNNGAGFTDRAAAYLIGITDEDFPQGFGPIFVSDVEVVEPEAVVDESDDDEEKQAEMKSFRNWLKKRDRPDIDNFRAYHMTDEEKEFVYWQAKGAQPTIDTTTDDMIYQFSEAMRRLDDTVRESEQSQQ